MRKRDKSLRMRQDRGGAGRADSARKHAGYSQKTDDAVVAQRCSALHGDGRDVGGRENRSRGRACDSHGGRAAVRARRRRPRSRRRGAALDGRIAYTEALGIPSLRARIARHYKETYRFDVDPERIIVTTGSSAGFILAFLAMFEAGARVGIANPGYPPYRHILTALGCEPVLIETNAATRWAVTPETLRAVHREDAARRRLDRVARPIRPAP